MTDDKRKVGFIGLGNMGKPQARNILKAGYPLTVHSRSAPPVDELVSEGAQRADSPKEVAAAVDVVVLSLPDTPDVTAVCLGELGIIEGGKPGLAVIDMSTISPTGSRKIAETLAGKGIRMLEAPVSGGTKGAAAGTLSIMAGGPQEVFDDVLPVLQTMGKNIVRVGEAGMGQTTKLVNNMMCAHHIAGIAEGFVLLAKAGVDLKAAWEAVRAGAAGCWSLDNKIPLIFERNFDPTFAVKLHHKDLSLAMDAGKDLGVPLPVTALVTNLYRSLIATGRGDLDNAALVRVIEDLAGVKIKYP